MNTAGGLTTFSGVRRVAASLLFVSAVACSSPSMPEADKVEFTNADDLVAETSAVEATDDTHERSSSTGSDGDGSVPDEDRSIVIRADLPGREIDQRVFGVNVPAWIGPEKLADAAFRQATIASGATLLRMPGGSWSNAYDWAGCEQGDSDRCFWTWAARPTDFLEFMSATGLPGMWTVSINETAQSAAAVVAFFNGAVGDDRVIGVDREGVDWGTVSQWAELRAAGGNAEPVPISLWEVGNEVYGGKPATGGGQCADFGWEDVWTCDGAEYVAGDGDHDGMLAIRSAMLAVDPSIEVGAVGVADPASWSDWGNEVIAASGDALDFFVVHQYGFDNAPPAVDVLQRPAELWPGMVDGLRRVLPDGTEVAITEYNLVAFEQGDGDGLMTKTANGLYLADTLGQFVADGADIANVWNLANGVTESGTDYGLINLDDGSTYPAYDAFQLWGEAGDELLTVDGVVADQLRLYPTRGDDGGVLVLVINLSDQPTDVRMRIAGIEGAIDATYTARRAEALDAPSFVDDPPIDPIAGEVGALELTAPAWSIGMLEVARRG